MFVGHFSVFKGPRQNSWKHAISNAWNFFTESIEMPPLMAHPFPFPVQQSPTHSNTRSSATGWLPQHQLQVGGGVSSHNRLPRCYSLVRPGQGTAATPHLGWEQPSVTQSCQSWSTCLVAFEYFWIFLGTFRCSPLLIFVL